MTQHPLKRICSVLGISRATAYRQTKPRPRVYQRADEIQVLEEVRTITRRKDSYGYRRVTARVNRLFRKRYNEKRIRRVMRIHRLQIPPKVRRRTGRAHTGRIATEQSNVRWCSDALEISCWSGEIVQVSFVLDCCDRETLAWVAAPRDLTGEARGKDRVNGKVRPSNRGVCDGPTEASVLFARHDPFTIDQPLGA